VVGLRTWELVKEGESSDAIVRVETPKEAARRALELAWARPRR
jgi:hypothetical protein